MDRCWALGKRSLKLDTEHHHVRTVASIVFDIFRVCMDMAGQHAQLQQAGKQQVSAKVQTTYLISPSSVRRFSYSITLAPFKHTMLLFWY